jgi:hypothetical protein
LPGTQGIAVQKLLALHACHARAIGNFHERRKPWNGVHCRLKQAVRGSVDIDWLARFMAVTTPGALESPKFMAV